jgi:CRP/FNR family transcriptional regulator, cyclic AMP receptor protein
MLDSKIGLLEKLPIFEGLSEKQLGVLVKIATKAFFQSGDNMITKDEAGTSAFLIITGSAKCINFPGADAPRKDIGPGSLVGELAMLVHTVHSLTVQANERVRAMAISREALWQAMHQDPIIAQKISDNLLVRLQNLAEGLRRFDRLLQDVERTTGEPHRGNSRSAGPYALDEDLHSRAPSIKRYSGL